jgi:hypothetical protein
MTCVAMLREMRPLDALPSSVPGLGAACQMQDVVAHLTSLWLDVAATILPAAHAPGARPESPEAASPPRQGSARRGAEQPSKGSGGLRLLGRLQKRRVESTQEAQ